MIEETTLAGLLNAIYQAAIDFSRWPNTLRLVDAAHGGLGEPEQTQLHQYLAPHIARAMQFNVRLARLELRSEAFAEILNRLEQAVLLVDAAGDGLRVIEGVLAADLESDTARLHALIASYGRDGAEAGAVGSLALSRGANRTPLSLLVTPLRFE